MAEQSPAPNLSQDSAGDSSDRAPRGCPECGSTQYHRTKRTPLERLQFRPPMASCENCEARFPYPGARRKFPEPLKSAVVAEAPSGSAEEKKAPKMAEGETQATATEPVAAANASDQKEPRCPACGSTEYHRTRRTPVERLQFRPAMARCDKCGVRFLYPGRRRKFSEPLKLALAPEAPARPQEEIEAPRLAGGDAQVTVTEGVAAADASDRKASRCPECGSTEYHRTRRTSVERLQFRPAMARCDKCETRFPYPGRRRKYPEPLKLAVAGTGPGSQEEKTVLTMAEENSTPQLAQQETAVAYPYPGTAADSSNRGLSRCPACGSMSYRRSRRTTLERLLFRPKMARCRRCRQRFPYPKG